VSDERDWWMEQTVPIQISGCGPIAAGDANQSTGTVQPNKRQMTKPVTNKRLDTLPDHVLGQVGPAGT
jgi:hypothetical protein